MQWCSFVSVERARAFGRSVRRYLTVGVGTTLVDWIILGLLVRYAGWSAAAANLVSRPCGGLFSFAFNKVWTFERRELRGTGSQFVRYGCLWLCAYALSEALIWGFSSRVGWGPFQSKIVAEALVNVVGYLVMRYWTFRTPRNGTGA